MGPGPFTPDPLGSTWPAPFPWLSFGFTGPVPGFSLVVTTPPTAEPVSVTEAKRNCRIDHSDEDVLFAIWIGAARRLIETEAATCLMQQTLTLSLPSWPMDGQVRLPVGPVSAVNSVKYYDAGGTFQTLVANTDYQTWLDYRPPLVVPAPQKFWPVLQFGKVPAVQVQYVAGYSATASGLPETARAAVMMTVAYWSENRGDEEAPQKYGLPEGVIRLIRLLNQTGYR